MRAYHTASCKGCGESFQTRAPDPTYCSKSCSNRARAGYGRVDRVCERCGAEFQAYRSEVERGGGRFCSHECADAANVGKRTKLETRPCERCGNPVTRKPSEFGEHAYCSKSCAGKANHPVDREKKVERECRACGKTFTLWATQAANGEGVYCSRECRESPIGTRRERDDGYIEVRVDGGWELEHRIVAESVIGRPLTSEEHVHHDNGRRNDNRPENLVVLTPTQHGAITWQRTWLATGHTWSMHADACVDCGSNERPHKGHDRCNRCWIRWRNGTTGPYRRRKVRGKSLD